MITMNNNEGKALSFELMNRVGSGLKACRVVVDGRRSFSIPLRGNLPLTYMRGLGGWTQEEVVKYVTKYGTRRQKGLMELAAIRLLTCEFVEASTLVPEGWNGWFWAVISDNAPFSWGDNNRSMVTARDFLRHCEDRLIDVVYEQDGVSQREVDNFLDGLRNLGETYIDLEN